MGEENVLQGPPLERITEGLSLGQITMMSLQSNIDTVLLIDAHSEERCTGGTILAKVIVLTKWLQKQGIKVGDIISVCSENNVDFLIIAMAVFMTGASLAPVNPDYMPGELSHILKLVEPKILFVTEKGFKNVINVKDRPDTKLVNIGMETANFTNIDCLEKLLEGVSEKDIDDTFEPVPLDPNETIATIMCSSGTTGLPKGVMCSHDNLTSCIDVVRTYRELLMQNKGIEDTKLPSQVFMGLMPFFHASGLLCAYFCLLGGGTTIVVRKFSPKLFLEIIPKYKVTDLIVPPTVCTVLLRHPLAKSYDLSSIRNIRSATSKLHKDSEIALSDMLPKTSVAQSYGMTEATLGVLVAFHGTIKPGSCGKIVPGMIGKVIDENGRSLGPYKEGEFCVKGPLVMKGYYRNVAATKEAIDADGWLHTGDLMYYDEDGVFFIVDRLKELIKYKGFQIAPAELEALLMQHPAVKDCAVVGLRDSYAGEVPVAFVVKKDGKNVAEAELQKYVADNLSVQKHLRGGVIFIDEIPRNDLGKILRRILKKRAEGLKSKL